MTPTQAAALLGLLPAELKSAQSIRSAFARKVKELHPDYKLSETHPFGASVIAAFHIGDIKRARDVLLQELANQNNACTLCCGTGQVRGRIGMQGCSACEGTGERK